MNRKIKWAQTVLALLFFHQGAFGATTLKGFPARLDGSVEVAAPVAGDIDGDGRPELVLATLNRLYALRIDGGVLSGFPVEFAKGNGISTPLAVGVIGPEGSPVSILFGTENGELWAVDGKGASLTGFPVKALTPLGGAPTLGDVNGDRSSEIVFGTKDGKVHVLGADAREVAGYPAFAGAPVSTTVTVGRFRPSGSSLLLFGDEEGRIHVWSGPGKELAGFPSIAQYAMASQPVLGDIDDDGLFEVVFGSKDFKVYVIKEDGTPAPGFPVLTGYRIYSTCALADVDGDGVTDIVAASGDGKLYALGQGGRALRGFPIAVGQRLKGSPVAGDVDLDGKVEIAVGTDRNNLTVVRNDGTTYPGFPVRMEEQVFVAPLLGDFNNDRLVEVAAVSRDGTVGVYRFLKKGNASEPLAWPMDGRDAARRAATYPNPPRYSGLKIAPQSPRTSDSLRLSYAFHDLDGDPEPRTVIQWFRNGKRVAELDNAREVPASATKKHERWHFTLQAELNTRPFTGPPVTIGNTVPGPPLVAIQPDPSRTADNLTLKVVRESDDVDRDKVRYTISWLKDRTPMKGFNGQSVPASQTAKGQRWTVVVTPNDGEVSGVPARAFLIVANTAPAASRFRLEPARPTIKQDVRVLVERLGADPDGDKVANIYDWEANERPLNLRSDSVIMPAGFVAKHGKIRVVATAFDGDDQGGKSEALAEVVNTPPTAPTVRILPAAPRTDDDLILEILKPSEDPDRDEVRYSFSWERAGKPYLGSKGQGPTLPASETSKAEKWLVRVTPSDGEEKGPAAIAEVLVANTPPQPPVVDAVNPRPPTTEDLVLKVVKEARDPDGDPLAVEVIWSDGKKEIARGRDMWRFPAGQTVKHGRYLATLVPADGTDTGAQARQWFEVQNTPPGPCRVSLEPAESRTGAPINAMIAEKPVDPDGDVVQIRYRWFLNGEPVENGSRPEQVDGRRVKRDQRWNVSAIPFDGEIEGPSCEASLVVGNTPPSAPEIVLEPARPTTLDSLAVRVSKRATDSDGDRVTIRTQWMVDDRLFAEGDGSEFIPAGALKKGQRWTVNVVASDGELKSAAVAAQTVVINSAPAAPKIEIQPAAPLSSDELYCRLSAPTPDPDRDALDHSFEWFQVKGKKDEVGGAPDHTGPTLPAARLRKGQRWTCRAKAFDGEIAGPTVTTSVTIGNAAPTAPKVEIEPVNPAIGQVLRCVIQKEATDPDGDKVIYRFRWSKDGMVQSFSPNTDNVPPRLTKGQDIWQCSALASDGQVDSLWTESIEVVILPTPVTDLTSMGEEKS